MLGCVAIYFSPLVCNSPAMFDEICKWNDVELVDLDIDPDEMINLAAEKAISQDLVIDTNKNLEALIKAEIKSIMAASCRTFHASRGRSTGVEPSICIFQH